MTSTSIIVRMATVTAAALAFAGLTGTSAIAQDSKPLALGAKAPLASTKLDTVDGKSISIDKAAGKKGTMVLFTCNGCPYARAWEERIVELGNSFSKKGIGVLLVNSNNPQRSDGDTAELTRARAKERGMQFSYALDPQSQVARAFGASKTPEAFVFDKEGKLVYHGTVDDNHEDPAAVQKRYLKDALEAVAAGKTPAMQETKSLGCGIKFPRA